MLGLLKQAPWHGRAPRAAPGLGGGRDGTRTPAAHWRRRASFMPLCGAETQARTGGPRARGVARAVSADTGAGLATTTVASASRTAAGSAPHR